MTLIQKQHESTYETIYDAIFSAVWSPLYEVIIRMTVCLTGQQHEADKRIEEIWVFWSVISIGARFLPNNGKIDWLFIWYYLHHFNYIWSTFLTIIPLLYLMSTLGWRDEIKEFCKDVIRMKGLEQITVEELVSEITPYGRAQIPLEIKAELLKRIRYFLQSTGNK